MRWSDRLLIISVLAVASACGRATGSVGGGTPVVEGSADDAGCAPADLQFSLSEDAVNQASLALVESMKSHGVPTADLNDAPSGSANRVMIMTGGVDLRIPSSEDPRAGLLAWLESAPASPFRAADYQPLNQGRPPSETAVGDFYWADFTRSAIGDLPFPASTQEGLALKALVQKRSEGWALANFEYSPAIIFAGRSDAQTIARCTESQSEHPDATAVLGHEYSGYTFQSCVEVGQYTYTAHPNDHVAWPDQPHWSILAAELSPADHASWTQIREADLTIDPLNDFTGIDEDDCSCPAPGTNQMISGFTIQVDVRTGDVLWFLPGLHGCIIC